MVLFLILTLCIETNGTSPYFFLHVPKTSGTAFLKNLPKVGVSFRSKTHGYSKGAGKSGYPGALPDKLVDVLSYEVQSDLGIRNLIHEQDKLSNTEQSNTHVDDFLVTKDGRYLATLVRNPYAHIASQYFHCKQFKHNQTIRLIPDTFSEWVEPFVLMETLQQNLDVSNGTAPDERSIKRREFNHQMTLLKSKIRSFGCYNPVNLQSRAISKYSKRIYFLGLTEEHRASLCVLSYLIKGSIAKGCNCTALNNKTKVQPLHSQPWLSLAHTTHGVVSRKLTHSEMRTASSVIQDDLKLYDEAKSRFWNMLRKIEQESKVTICRDL